MLLISSIGMRRTSLIEWPAWLKFSDTGVVVLTCRFVAVVTQILIPFVKYTQIKNDTGSVI